MEETKEGIENYKEYHSKLSRRVLLDSETGKGKRKKSKWWEGSE